MTDPASSAPRQDSGTQSSPPPCGEFLDRSHVVVDLCVASRKRLFEEFSALLVNSDRLVMDGETPSESRVFSILHDRERLGCTALGRGIAVPHGRLEGLTEPAIAIARLREPVNYDSADGVPVWLAVCLLVPVDANEVHLNLLAALAAKFSDDTFVEQVKSCETADELYEYFRSL